MESTSRRPNSPDAAASTHRVVSDPRHGEADHGTSHPEGRKRSTSVSDLLNKILPSRRPERRGTLRDQGFWEEQQAGGINPSHIPSPSQRPKLRARHGSDSIASSAWNQPTDLPRRTQSTYRDQRGKLGSLLSPSRQANDNRPRSSTTSKEPPAHSPVQEHQGIRTEKVMQARTEVMPSTVPQQPADHRTASKSATVPDSFALFDQKREARRLRRSLKESRDFLGVQGVNPHTGVMDVITPTSSSPSDNTMRSLPELKGYSETMSDFRSAYQRASRSQDAEEASLSLLRKEQERLARLQRHKDTIRAFQHRVRWQKERNQWSSVAEPCLSPILDQSVKSRSTSAGGLTPPPGTVQNTRGTKRVFSNPAGLQTTAPAPTFATPLATPPASPAQNRPKVVPQDSSDTVIHTPVDSHSGAQRRFSLIAEILGNETKSSPPSAAREVSETAKSPNVLPSPSSNHVIRRKPVPASSPGGQQLPEPKLVTPESRPHKLPSVPSNHQDPFLGTRTEPVSATTQYLPSPATVTSSSPGTIPAEAEEDHTSNPTYLDQEANDMPANVHTMDFADEKSRQAAFATHLSHLDRPATLPPAPTFSSRRDTNEGTASLPKRKSLRPHRVPLLPRRLGSSAKETSKDLSSGPAVPPKSTDLFEMTKPPPLTPRVSQPETDDTEPTSGWAKQLIQDMEVLSGNSENVKPEDLELNKEPTAEDPLAETEESTGSAYTPTTIITGYDHDQLRHAQNQLKEYVFDGPGDSVTKDDPAIPSSMPQPDLVKVQVTQAVKEVMDLPLSPKSLPQKPARVSTQPPQTQQSYDLLSSPPRLPPNVWPSIAIPRPQSQRPGTAQGSDQQRPTYTTTTSYPRPSTAPGQRPVQGSATTLSAHQLRPTRQRYDRLCRRASPRPTEVARATSSTEASRERSRERGTKSDNTTTRASRAASPTYMSMYQQHNRSFTSSLVTSSNNTSSSSVTRSESDSQSHPRQRQRQPAQEAARMALMTAEAKIMTAEAKIVTVPSPSRNASVVSIGAAWDRRESTRKPETGEKKPKTGEKKPETGEKNQPGMGEKNQPETGEKNQPETGEKKQNPKDADAIVDPSKDEAVVRRVPLKDEKEPEPTETTESRPGIPKKAGDMLVRFAIGYWTLVAPVFNAVSPISKRLSARQSTWHDCIVYLLALAFVLLVLLLTVWSVRGVVMAVQVVRAVSEGFAVLIGF